MGSIKQCAAYAKRKGYFRENVVIAKVVLPSGDVRNFTGDELELIADAEGITGLISEVTLRIQPYEDIEVAGLASPDANRLQELVNSIIGSKLPIWSMVFINPQMAEMKNRAPVMEHGGHAIQDRVMLPAKYILTLAFRKKDSTTVRAELPGLARSSGADILSDKIAEHDFKTRIDPKNIMNPGKVTSIGLMGIALGIAGAFEPIIRPLGNSVTATIGERPLKQVRDIPADVAWYAYSCSQCGYCIDECDQFYGRGWESQSPRGKWYWLREYMEGRVEWDQKMVDTIISCTTCELCNLRCSGSSSLR